MRIVSMEPITVAIPYRHEGPLTGFGGSVWPTLRYLLVRVETEDGLIGWGEAFGYGVIPATAAVIRETLAPLAIGRDAADVAGLMEEIKKTVHIYGRGGPTQYALGGLDIALWDLAGKRAGRPLAELLGGLGRKAIDAYSSLMRLSDPATVRRGCERALQKGFRAVKLHETTEPAVTAAREALGPDTALMVDVNCAWRFDEALAMARSFERNRLTWLEEPIWPPEDVASMERLRAAGDTPLAAGENVPNAWAFKPLASGALDYLQPSVTKVGGITEFMKVASLAEFNGKRIAPHSPYFGPGLLATIQIAAACPLISWIECFGVELETPLFGSTGLPDGNGSIAVPTGPGLGMDPDPDVLARLRVT
jgi:L-alanine-DL-glutamate epimerase-like enolase superfamily enzyme